MGCGLSGRAENQKKAAPGADEQPGLDLVLPFVGARVTETLRKIAPEVLANFEADDDAFVLDGAAPARRPAGRPKGSPNKSTADLRKFLISTLGHPLVGTAMVGTWRSFDELVTKVVWLSQAMGVTREAALGFVSACNARIAPYVEGQMPVRIDAKIAAGVTIAIGEGMFALPETPPANAVDHEP